MTQPTKIRANICTIVCDASHCQHTKAGGWAAWVVANGNRFKHSGSFKELCATPHIAEIQAALNGLFIATRNVDARRYHFVMDCRGAMNALKHQAEWKAKVVEMAGDAEITFAHVKAHTNGTKARDYVNNWCDKQARRAMHRKKGEIREGTSTR